MERLLLWIDDEKAPYRGKAVAAGIIAVGGLLGVVIGVVAGLSAADGLVAGLLVASALGVVLGVAGFFAGAQAKGDSAWQHGKRSWRFGSYGKGPRDG